MILTPVPLFVAGHTRSWNSNIEWKERICTICRAHICMYAMTPDEDFILDRLPGYDNVVVAAGFSGHGFKFGPVIGEMMASLVTGEEAEFSLEPFALSRFV